MKLKIIYISSIIIFFICQSHLISQVTYDLRFVQILNEGVMGGSFDVKVQIKANNGTFGLGTSNLVFEFNTDGLQYDDSFQPLNYNNSPYLPMSVTELVDGRWSINILLFSGTGQTVPNSYSEANSDVVTLNFTILEPTETSNLTWRTQSPNATIVFDDADAPNIIPANNLNGFDVPLPVLLSIFRSEFIQDKVKLYWLTEGEIENTGFEVLKSAEKEGDYSVIADYHTNPELKGQGNTTYRHEYIFIDEDVQRGNTYWYKITDVDFNGNKTFHGPISATLQASGMDLTSITHEVPSEFKLYPNYPNPFNPETVLRFDVPKLKNGQAPAQIIIFNSLGQYVRTLYQGTVGAGSFEIQWDGKTDLGNNLPTGIYYAALKIGLFSQTIKLVMIK